MSFEELFILHVIFEVHVVELLQVAYIFAPVGHSLRQTLPVFDECEFGSLLGNLDELIGLLGLHEPLLGIPKFLNLPLLGLSELVCEAVKDGEHGLVSGDLRLGQFGAGDLLAHWLLLIR